MNSTEIPTPYTGEYVSGKNARFTLSSIIKGDCKVVELKVIAIAKDRMPSEVSYKRYELRHGIQPKKVQQEDSIVQVSAWQTL